MDQKPTFEDVLAVYNSITPSRRRWVRLRNQLRNEWKELYKVLEEASGRAPGKVVVFDANWHTLADKGGVRGAVNKTGEAATREEVVETAEVVEQAVEVAKTEAIEVKEESVAESVSVKKTVTKKVASKKK